MFVFSDVNTSYSEELTALTMERKAHLNLSVP